MTSGREALRQLYTVHEEARRLAPPLTAQLRVWRARISQKVSVWNVWLLVSSVKLPEMTSCSLMPETNIW